eukprot:268636_1
MSESNTKFATIITITYASIYTLIFLITSIVCAKTVRQNRKNKKVSSSKSTQQDVSENAEKSPLSSTNAAAQKENEDITIDIEERTNEKTRDKWYDGIKEWFSLIREKKKIYLSLVPHIFDQATDIGVIYQYYALWKDTEKDTKEINAVNPKNFFYASIFVIILHRIISSIAIYNLTRKWKDFILQTFDLMLVKAIWVNYKLRKHDKANPQRFLEILEATFESGPQLLISSAYILKTTANDSGTITPLMIISVLSSLWSITSRVATDDKSLFVRMSNDRYRNAWTESGFTYKDCPCLHWQYVFRIIIWRFLEITNRVFLCILVWINMGGFSLCIILGFEVLWCLVVSIWTVSQSVNIKMNVYRVDPMSVLLYISFNIGGESRTAKNVFFAFIFYRFVSNWIYLTLTTIFALIDFGAPKVEEYEIRNVITVKTKIGLFMLVYTWITSCIWPYAGIYTLFTGSDGKDAESTARDLECLFSDYQWDDIVELMEFGVAITADDAKERGAYTALHHISKSIHKSVFNLNGLIVMQRVIAVVPETIDTRHALHELELECMNGGGLIHLAVKLPFVFLEEKSTEILEEIIESQNIDINLVNNDGQSALHCIASFDVFKPFGKVNITNAQILLTNGINKHIKDKNNKTALNNIMEKRNMVSKVKRGNDTETEDNVDQLIQLLS